MFDGMGIGMAIITNLDFVFGESQGWNQHIVITAFGAEDLSTCTTMALSFQEGELDGAFIAVGAVVILLPGRSEANVGRQDSHRGRLRGCREQPLRCQNCGFQVDTQIDGAWDIAFDLESVMALDMVTIGRWLDGKWDLEGQPLDSIKAGVESTIIGSIDLGRMVEMVTMSSHTEMLVHFEFQSIGWLGRSVIDFEFGDDGISWEIAVLVEPDLDIQLSFG